MSDRAVRAMAADEIRREIRQEVQGTAAAAFVIPCVYRRKPSIDNPANWELDLSGVFGAREAVAALTEAAGRVQRRVALARDS